MNSEFPLSKFKSLSLFLCVSASLSRSLCLSLSYSLSLSLSHSLSLSLCLSASLSLWLCLSAVQDLPLSLSLTLWLSLYLSLSFSISLFHSLIAVLYKNNFCFFCNNFSLSLFYYIYSYSCYKEENYCSMFIWFFNKIHINKLHRNKN